MQLNMKIGMDVVQVMLGNLIFFILWFELTSTYWNNFVDSSRSYEDIIKK